MSELIAELDANRSPESAVRAALDRVGEETSGILQRARESANAITERSRADAHDRVAAAEREAGAIRADAEARTVELEADIESLWRERTRLIEEIRQLADQVLALADGAAERMQPPGGDPGDGSPEDPTTDSMPPVEADFDPSDEDTGDVAAEEERGDAGEGPELSLIHI